MSDSHQSMPCRRKRRLPILAADAKALSQMLGLGVRTIRTMDAAGKLPQPIHLSARVVWSVAEIRRWLEAGAPPREEWDVIRKGRE